MAITDNFNRADGPPTGWTDTHAGGISIVSNAVRGDGGTASQCSAAYTGVAWNADHSSQAVRVNASNDVAVAVRVTAGGNYYAYFNVGSVQENSAGSEGEIGSVAPYANGQTAKMSATGTTLEMFIGGVSQGTVIDASQTAGGPGLAFYEEIGLLDDWVGTGEVAAGGKAFPFRSQHSMSHMLVR